MSAEVPTQELNVQTPEVSPAVGLMVGAEVLERGGVVVVPLYDAPETNVKQTGFEQRLLAANTDTVLLSVLLEDESKSDQLANRAIHNGGAMRYVVDAIGFKLDTLDAEGADKEALLISEVPKPELLVKNVVEKFGVDIELLKGEAVIGPRVYLGVFAGKKYPVATNSEQYFLHDTGDDHLTGVVLGGNELMTSLAEVANRVLSTNDDALISKATGNIDTFTSLLRTVALGEAHSDDPNGYKNDRTTFVYLGKKLGISEDAIENIIAKSQKAYEAFSLTPAQDEANRVNFKAWMEAINAAETARRASPDYVDDGLPF